MHAVPRRIGAALIGAIVMAALALTMTGQAHAADQTVRLTQFRSSTNTVLALSAGGNPDVKLFALAKRRSDPDKAQRWIKHDVGNGNYATYKNVYYGKCLQALTQSSTERLTLGPCQSGDSRQMWTQKFDSGMYRRLENLASARAATSHTDIYVTQQFYTGLESQGWAIVGI
jgi:hypothetical protein